MEMAEIGKTSENGVTRAALSKEDGQARDLLCEWAKPLVDQMLVDEVGNMFFIKKGANPNLPLVLSGSHLDTQYHGGRFDGVYGVLSVLEVLKTLHENQIILGKRPNLFFVIIFADFFHIWLHYSFPVIR